VSRRKPAALAALALALLACGTGQTGGQRSPVPSQAAANDTRAADLRARLDLLLGEHLLLSARATGAALGGRADEFAAYATQLNRSAADLGDLVGGALGVEVESGFSQAWSAHDTHVVEYATGAATHDQDRRAAAVSGLTTEYVPQVADVLAGATGMPKASVDDLAAAQVRWDRQVVDDQAARDWPATFADLRKAGAQARAMGDALAAAMARRQAARFPGDLARRGVDLRVTLDGLLQEHAYLATAATAAAIGGRTDEFQAAARALGDNGAELGGAASGPSGAGAQERFDQAWGSLDDQLVDYAVAGAKKDAGAQQGAVSGLTGTVVPQLAELLAGSSGLPRSTLAGLLRDHVLAVRDVVDAQVTGDPQAAALGDRTAAQQTQAIAGPLAAAMAAKLPDRS